MKPYKMNVLNALTETAAGKTNFIENEISIKEVAQSAGVTRLTSEEIREIVFRFQKSYPEYRLVLFSDTSDKMRYASLWENGVLTCLEYDDGSEYGHSLKAAGR